MIDSSDSRLVTIISVL